MGYFFNSLGIVLNIVLQGLMLIILVNALLSWIRPNPDNPAVQLLERVSDFVCNPIRRLFPTVVSGFDLAPLIAMLALTFLSNWLVPMLRNMM